MKKENQASNKYYKSCLILVLVRTIDCFSGIIELFFEAKKGIQCILDSFQECEQYGYSHIPDIFS